MLTHHHFRAKKAILLLLAENEILFDFLIPPRLDLLPSDEQSEPTGSFRKNGKSKTVFSTKFHKNLIFSAFFSQELATNLCC